MIERGRERVRKRMIQREKEIIERKREKENY